MKNHIIHWMNDTTQLQIIYIYDLYVPAFRLSPQRSVDISIDVDEGKKLFIKTWPDGKVLISTMESS